MELIQLHWNLCSAIIEIIRQEVIATQLVQLHWKLYSCMIDCFFYILFTDVTILFFLVSLLCIFFVYSHRYPSPKIINLLTPNDAYLVRKSAIIHIKYEEDDENDTNTTTSTTTTNNNNTTEEKVPEELQEGVPIEMSYDALLIDVGFILFP